MAGESAAGQSPAAVPARCRRYARPRRTHGWDRPTGGDDAVRYRRRRVVAAARRHLGIGFGCCERQRRRASSRPSANVGITQCRLMHHTPAVAPAAWRCSPSRRPPRPGRRARRTAHHAGSALGCCIIQMPSVLATVLPWNAPTGFSVCRSNRWNTLRCLPCSVVIHQPSLPQAQGHAFGLCLKTSRPKVVPVKRPARV